MFNGPCRDYDYTIAQWLEHRWLQARVPGSSPGGDSQIFSSEFSRLSHSLKTREREGERERESGGGWGQERGRELNKV